MNEPVTYYSHETIAETIAERAIIAGWVLFWILLGIGMIILLLSVPVEAIDPVINPSVENQPVLCQYSLTKWLPGACPIKATGAPGEKGDQGDQGIQGIQGPAGIGGGQVLYFHHDTVPDPVGFEGLNIIPAGSPEDDETVSVTAAGGLKVFDPYITVTGYPGTTTWPAGLWRFRTFHYVSSNVGDSRIVFTVYNRTTSGTMTKLFDVMSEEIDDTVVTEHLTPYVQNLDYTVNSTDRMVINVSANTTAVAAKTVHFVYEGALHTSHVQTPLPLAYTVQPMINESYAYLPGRAGGQVLIGSTTSGGTLTLNGSSANNGNVNINPLGGSVSSGKLALEQTILGNYAGGENIKTYQTALGYFSGYNNTGESQSSIGFAAGAINTGDYQSSLGYDAGRENAGDYQVVAGYYAGYQNTGDSQVAYGYRSGRENSGVLQTSIGADAGFLNTGALQSALGYGAGQQNGGNQEIAIGTYAGYLNSGDNVIAIGYQAGQSNTVSNQLIIKQNNVNTNALIAGNFSTGIVQFPNYGAGTLYTDANGHITAVSDEKFKTNILSLKTNNKAPTTTAIQKINAFNPVCWNYNKESGLDTENRYCGWIAQDVQKIIPEAVYTRDDVRYETSKEKDVSGMNKTVEVKTGTHTLSVDDRAIIGTLILALQEEDAKVTAQQKQIDELKARLDKAGVKE